MSTFLHDLLGEGPATYSTIDSVNTETSSHTATDIGRFPCFSLIVLKSKSYNVVAIMLY